MRGREHLLGFFLLLVAVASGAGATRYAFVHWHPDIVLDADHCPPTPAATWLVALDITERWPRQEQEHVANRVLAIAERMHQHERLTLHVITARPEDSAAPAPVSGFPDGFRLCKSADPATVDPTVQNERLVRATYEHDFLNPLRTVLPELVTAGPARHSPLLQAIEIMRWSPLFTPDVPHRRLVIFSDLLIHTRNKSQLTQPLDDPCTTLASDIGTRLKARNWQGVTVILERLRNPRDATRQTAQHLAYWTRLFYLLGAAEVFDGPTLVANDLIACRSPATATRSSRPH